MSEKITVASFSKHTEGEAEVVQEQVLKSIRAIFLKLQEIIQEEENILPAESEQGSVVNSLLAEVEEKNVAAWTEVTQQFRQVCDRINVHSVHRRSNGDRGILNNEVIAKRREFLDDINQVIYSIQDLMQREYLLSESVPVLNYKEMIAIADRKNDREAAKELKLWAKVIDDINTAGIAFHDATSRIVDAKSAA